MYDLRAILKRFKFPISTTLEGRSFHSRIILTKKRVFILQLQLQLITMTTHMFCWQLIQD